MLGFAAEYFGHPGREVLQRGGERLAARPAMQRRMLTERRCHPVLEIETDHWPWLSRTDEFLAAMAAIVSTVA